VTFPVMSPPRRNMAIFGYPRKGIVSDTPYLEELRLTI
jgi:hypothetical protein